MMHSRTDETTAPNASEMKGAEKIFSKELRARARWFITIRWFVPPAIVLGLGIAQSLGIGVSSEGLVYGAALFIASYNVIFQRKNRQFHESPEPLKNSDIERFIGWQAGLDYAVLFLLIYFTGGVTSPLVFFLILHIIYTSILLPSRLSYGFSAAVAGFFFLLAVLSGFQILPYKGLLYHGQWLIPPLKPMAAVLVSGFFGASAVFIVISTTSIIEVLRRKMVGKADQTTTRSDEIVTWLRNGKSLFMLKAAHNLRAPLSAMLSIIEVLRGEYLGELNDDQKEHLRRLDRRAKTMLAIIDELLTLADKRDISKKPVLKPLECGFIAGRIRRTFEDEANQKGQSFFIHLEDDLPPILGDLEMLEQMMENLVSNAIKYTPAGGMIDIFFSKENGKEILIRVKDTGIGIPKDQQNQVFREFFRARNARNIEEHGTGLGLAIIREIAGLHGGRIVMKSEEGQGSVFTVHLPTAKQEV